MFYSHVVRASIGTTIKLATLVYTNIVCLCCSFMPPSVFFSHIETYGFEPVLYQAEDNVSSSRTQHSSSGETRTIDPSIPSQTLYLSTAYSTIESLCSLKIKGQIRIRWIIEIRIGSSDPPVCSGKATH